MNNITELPANVFRNLLNLEELRLAGNDLAFIHPEALSGLHLLKVLTLSSSNGVGGELEAFEMRSSIPVPTPQIQYQKQGTAVDVARAFGQREVCWMLQNNQLKTVPSTALKNLNSLQSL
ncbi:hypothetical protein DNTS_032539 [Danionella cerebrum]|uniref:Uncharacterized protein n=1 Tax=Danionella cerebrum TaxID=2873325 RepID=A0A553RB48_9TELE|nr:hypothetical protein DNTS_032539 [Danionella translucida]